MDMTLSKFMGIAITALVIAGLIFGVAVTSLKSETNGGTGSYKANMESPAIPSAATIGS
ncbi:MAG: hypothetical protein R3267_02390 [Paenisporosarcina sp.]|nr:hypothetical protein [Paenisporosarcina sp.]